ncbi:MAG: type II toxin-antitoxin system VapC family toxin [Rhizomicrobium sp.]
MLVVDASVAVKWFLLEADRAAAIALQQSSDLIAPELIVPEVVNTIWRNIRVGKVVPAFMPVVTARLPAVFARLAPMLDFAARAGEIALALDHPAYDCFYIALAEREGIDLVTADSRLFAKTRGTAFDAIVRPLQP